MDAIAGSIQAGEGSVECQRFADKRRFPGVSIASFIFTESANARRSKKQCVALMKKNHAQGSVSIMIHAQGIRTGKGRRIRDE